MWGQWSTPIRPRRRAMRGKQALDEYSMIETVIAIGSIPVTPYGTPSTYEVPDALPLT